MRAIMKRVHPLLLAHYGPDSFFVASCEMILGLLDRTQHRLESAREHLTWGDNSQLLIFRHTFPGGKFIFPEV